MAQFYPSQPFDNPSIHPYGYKGAEGLGLASGNAGSLVTLLIRHLPEAIPHETLSRLLSHYGASAVRPCNSGRLKSCAFLDFANEQIASQVQRSLNGLRFLGKNLKVERASSPVQTNHKVDQPAKVVQLENNAPGSDRFMNLKMPSASVEEPIAPKLGIDYPFPPHLEYAYPPPDGNILTNIVNALIAVPRFYTQVLHLMNKMNIPAPFRVALPTPPLPPAASQPPPPPPPPASTVSKPFRDDLSESESEMESSEEDVDDKAIVTESSSTVRSKRKRARKGAIVGPAVDKGVTHEDVGVKPAALLPKEIPLIKKNNPVLQIKVAPRRTKADHKDDRDKNVLEKEKSNTKWFITAEELEMGKLPWEEILSLPPV